MRYRLAAAPSTLSMGPQCGDVTFERLCDDGDDNTRHDRGMPRAIGVGHQRKHHGGGDQAPATP
jgi:hypothetical protein